MKAELERAGAWMRGLNEEDRKKVAVVAASIVNKILHDPMTVLKEETRERDALPYVAAVRRLFRL